jgi:hypothetical protein
MDAVMDMVSRGLDQLLGRVSGPMHFRLVMMPVTVAILAIRAGIKDARAGRQAFLWSMFTNPADRRRLFRSALADIGRVFVFALVLDTLYQLVFLGEFHLLELLVVAVACAIVPYVLIRGPATHLARFFGTVKSRGSTKDGITL